MRKRSAMDSVILFLLVAGSVLLAVYLAVQVEKAVRGRPSSGKPAEGFLLIDPGHGGKDGGAVAEDGTVEKTINLDIALPLRDMLLFLGYPVEMTRDSDEMICDPGLKTLREQKSSDMRNRLKLYEQSRLTIGIHQNHFPQSQYYGTQIFYGLNDPESALAAKAVRETVLSMLQPQNKRELKKATKDIYLLHQTKVPAILVECGFLSNPAEREQLKKTDYQQKMAYAIACGVLAYES